MSLEPAAAQTAKAVAHPSPYAQVKVWFDGTKIWVQRPNKAAESIAFSELLGVVVETTDRGPVEENVWWHIASKEKILTYPSEATGAQELLPRLQHLPTFNNKRLIEAMSCTSNRMFILWDHQGRHK